MPTLKYFVKIIEIIARIDWYSNNTELIKIKIFLLFKKGFITR